jgi:hypothetical protein
VTHQDAAPDERRFDLHEAFLGRERELLAALETGRRNAGHSGVQGQGTEMHWQALLEAVLPARYKVSPAIVVDSRGGQSQQIDLVIRDGHFSPLFWEWGGHCYVPVESVYAVAEVKPEINREYLLYASDKIASVRSLFRTSVPFGWAMGTMEARKLPPILGMFLGGASGWSPTFGDPFRQALKDVVKDGRIDLGCVLGSASFEVPSDDGADAAIVGEANTALVSFTMTLLKRLQGLGSSPAIDYDAYAAWGRSRSTGDGNRANSR